MKYLSKTNRVFLDTTILVDAVLKSGVEGDNARKALAKYKERLLPQYAIKEFKAGALRNYIWLHTKSATLRTYDEIMTALTRMWARPSVSGTAWRAIRDFEHSISSRLPSDYTTRYPGQTLGEIQRAEIELWLRTLILRAWRKRTKIGTIVRPLTCYSEVDIKFTKNGIFEDEPIKCDVQDCCLRAPFVKRSVDIGKLLANFDKLPRKKETGRRKEALDHLHRTPNRPLSEKQCKALGDAVFVLQCPSDATLMTTNVADHGPLADAIGIITLAPASIIANS